MRTIYLFRNGQGYQEYPVPTYDQMPNFIPVEVEDDFDIDAHTYDMANGVFVIKDQDPEVLAQKIAQINQWRDRERESGFVEYNGKRYDRDSTARDNILGVLMSGVMPVPFWTTYDNEDEPATLDDLKQIYNLIIEAGGAIHFRQRQMKNEVASLTGAALANYVVGWGNQE